VVPQAETAIATLRLLLSARGFTVRRIGPIPSSLEDVFVALTSKRGQSAKEEL
jgi:hypothetical protein